MYSFFEFYHLLNENPLDKPIYNADDDEERDDFFIPSQQGTSISQDYQQRQARAAEEETARLQAQGKKSSQAATPQPKKMPFVSQTPDANDPRARHMPAKGISKAMSSNIVPKDQEEQKKLGWFAQDLADINKRIWGDPAFRHFVARELAAKGKIEKDSPLLGGEIKFTLAEIPTGKPNEIMFTNREQLKDIMRGAQGYLRDDRNFQDDRYENFRSTLSRLSSPAAVLALKLEKRLNDYSSRPFVNKERMAQHIAKHMGQDPKLMFKALNMLITNAPFLFDQEHGIRPKSKEELGNPDDVEHITAKPGEGGRYEPLSSKTTVNPKAGISQGVIDNTKKQLFDLRDRLALFKQMEDSSLRAGMSPDMDSHKNSAKLANELLAAINKARKEPGVEQGMLDDIKQLEDMAHEILNDVDPQANEHNEWIGYMELMEGCGF